MKAVILMFSAVVAVCIGMFITLVFKTDPLSIAAGCFIGVGFSLQWASLMVVYKPNKDQS